MSTRAIAPVVGTSNYTVQKDREAGVRDLTPEPQPLVNTGLGVDCGGSIHVSCAASVVSFAANSIAV